VRARAELLVVRDDDQRDATVVQLLEDAHDGPGQTRGTGIEGGVSHHLVKGDVITIPAKTPHQWKDTSKTGSVGYFAVNFETTAGFRFPPAVHYVDHDKVAAAFVKGGRIIEDQGLIVIANRVDLGGRNSSDGILVFNRTDNGDVVPRGIIAGPRTGIIKIRQVVVDEERGQIFATIKNNFENYDIEDQRPSPWNPDKTGFIGVWSITDNGDVPPRGAIKGPATGLIWPAGVAINPKNHAGSSAMSSQCAPSSTAARTHLRSNDWNGPAAQSTANAPRAIRAIDSGSRRSAPVARLAATTSPCSSRMSRRPKTPLAPRTTTRIGLPEWPRR